MYFHYFRHHGRYLEFLKMFNDGWTSSFRILNRNFYPTCMHQENNSVPDFSGPSLKSHLPPDKFDFSKPGDMGGEGRGVRPGRTA